MEKSRFVGDWRLDRPTVQLLHHRQAVRSAIET